MSAFNTLMVICERSSKHVVYLQPEMIPHWQGSFELELLTATKAALDAGTDPEKVYRLLHSKASVDLDELPSKFLAACVEGGLSPDTDMGGETLLHMLLNHPYPPPIKFPIDHIDVSDEAAEALQRLRPGCNPACGSVTLNELLSRKATPDLEDSAGNTAMHMLVACMVQRVHFPDPKLSEENNAANNEARESDAVHLEAAGGGSSSLQSAGQQLEAADADSSQVSPDQLDDNDAARAEYAEVAFRMLLSAGWSPAWRNHNFYKVSDLIEAGLTKYQTELYDLQDPQGAVQTTVALLADKAPDRNLHEFVQRKVAGVEAVVRCLQTLHSLSASAELPRKARSAVSLVVLWLLLVVGAVYIIIMRRQL